MHDRRNIVHIIIIMLKQEHTLDNFMTVLCTDTVTEIKLLVLTFRSGIPAKHDIYPTFNPTK